MSDQETQSPSQIEQMKPYLIASAVLIVILVVAFLWPSSDEKETIISEPVAITPVQPIAVETPAIVEPEVTPTEEELFSGTPEIQALEIETGEDIEPLPEIVEAEPLDESDAAVKNAFVELATSPLVAKYLVDESLLQKFVINVNSIANEEMSPNHNLLSQPENEFRVYTQADSEWIDASSYKRYNSYVDALESLSTDDLVKLMDTYRPTLESKFAEISPPNTSFDDALLKAIDELLDTPIVPMPIEVYSDSVMYKFKDEQLEALSGPQKQLIRTGPENTRRIKDVLRKLKDTLQD
mmetsp:Transcript_35644/g.112421  ORF Transcript_35644/g.112421 Transcript_35644/m.112421 type:complete len:296 (-) Transcript_35644:6012-6899(-)